MKYALISSNQVSNEFAQSILDSKGKITLPKDGNISLKNLPKILTWARFSALLEEIEKSSNDTVVGENMNKPEMKKTSYKVVYTNKNAQYNTSHTTEPDEELTLREFAIW
jgi:hypothetical protein